MHVQCYKKKTGKQFIDFLKRVEIRYNNDENIQKYLPYTFDNLSVHKSKKVKEQISKRCPRIKFVFFSIRSHDLI
jgi:hypothetical protein